MPAARQRKALFLAGQDLLERTIRASLASRFPRFDTADFSVVAP